MEYWTGILHYWLEWNTGMEYWNDLLHSAANLTVQKLCQANKVADNGFSPCAGMTHVIVLFWQCFCTLFGRATFRQSLEDHSSSPVFHSSSPVFQSSIPPN